MHSTASISTRRERRRLRATAWATATSVVLTALPACSRSTQGGAAEAPGAAAQSAAPAAGQPTPVAAAAAGPEAAGVACAGYALPADARLGAVPEPAPSQRVDVNGDGEPDVIAALPGGGSALYLNCGGSRYYEAVRSATTLEALPPEGSPWSPLLIAWEGSRVTIIDGQVYRPDLLPFASDAPADFLVHYTDGAYGLPFAECRALHLRAPRYRFDRDVDLSARAPQEVSMLHLELARSDLPIDLASQEEYAVGPVHFTDLNADTLADAVLEYAERYGSGREGQDALLLNCGDDAFVLAGTVRRGAVGVSEGELHGQTLEMCNTRFVALAATRATRSDDAALPRTHADTMDLYLYRPVVADFYAVTGLPPPTSPDFAARAADRCAEIERPARILGAAE